MCEKQAIVSLFIYLWWPNSCYENSFELIIRTLYLKGYFQRIFAVGAVMRLAVVIRSSLII